MAYLDFLLGSLLNRVSLGLDVTELLVVLVNFLEGREQRVDDVGLSKGKRAEN